MRFKFVYLSVCMTCLLTACNSEQDDVLEQKSITFEIESTEDASLAAKVTRGTPITIDNLENWGVFGYVTKGEWLEGIPTQTLFNNQKVTREASSNPIQWTYFPLEYWPISPYLVSYFAYAPYVSADNGLQIKEIAEKGIEITYSPSTNVNNQVDLLIAEPLPNKSKQGGQVVFSFNHVLSQIVINLRKEKDDQMTYLVKSCQIEYPKSAILDVFKNEGIMTWKSFSEEKVKTPLIDSNNPILLVETDQYLPLLFLYPPSDSESFSIKIEISYETTNFEGFTTSFDWEKTIQTNSWEMSHRYIYTFILKQNGYIVVNVPFVEDWIEDEKSPQDQILLPGDNDLQVTN